MIPNCNLSVLPWYGSPEQQNARKWWIYNRIYPLYTPLGYLPPFQIKRQNVGTHTLTPSETMNAYLPTQTVGNPIQFQEIGVGPDESTIAYYDIPEGVEVIDYVDIPSANSSLGGAAAMQIVFIKLVSVGLDIQQVTGQFAVPYDGYLHNGTIAIPEGSTGVWVNIFCAPTNPYTTGHIDADTGLDTVISEAKMFTPSGEFVADITTQMQDACLFFRQPDAQYSSIVYNGLLPVFQDVQIGQYYIRLSDSHFTWYSEIFTIIDSPAPYLCIEWWDNADFPTDAGIILYRGGFKNKVYLCSDLAKPEYVFTEEGQERDGYFFPQKQISEKKYRFQFFASEYMLDVMRFIRMADHVKITYSGQEYSVDTFLITPEWERNGDVASVTAEFETATVAKKIGMGYAAPGGGDFNDDFNNDFLNS